MQYKAFKDGVSLSRLGMGNMRLPVVGGSDSAIDYDSAKALIDRCMAQGINYYDTAYIYHGGKSEEFLGRALADYPREDYYVADKFNIQADPDYKGQFSKQLARLHMDHIDFYLLHGIQDGFLDDMLENGCIDYFHQMKQAGKLRYLGFSYHGSPARLPELLRAYPWDFAQIQLNYYDWFFGDAKELYDLLTAAHIPVMVMEPVHGGLLANLTPEAGAILTAAAPERSQASWAMRWVMGLDNVQVVLSGMSTLDQVADNAAVFHEALPLTAEEQEKVKAAAGLHRSTVAVACTACRYCCPDCPVGLDIPKLLSAYNDAKLSGAWRLSNLAALPEEKRPTACIGCGSCTKHCPQSFDIPHYMAELSRMAASMED